MFPWELVDGLWATKSKGVGLIVRAISFQDFQPMWSWSTNVKDRRTDGQTTCDLNTALCTSASRGKNWDRWAWSQTKRYSNPRKYRQESGLIRLSSAFSGPALSTWLQRYNGVICYVFVLFFLYLYCRPMSPIIHIQLWAASIDGLRPTWQPAIIYTLLFTVGLCMFLLWLIKLLLSTLYVDCHE